MWHFCYHGVNLRADYWRLMVGSQFVVANCNPLRSVSKVHLSLVFYENLNLSASDIPCVPPKPQIDARPSILVATVIRVAQFSIGYKLIISMNLNPNRTDIHHLCISKINAD